jgi:nucleotide-binding universal stress UspA family protein
MTIVVGVAPEERGKAALYLAGELARSVDEELLLCAVIPVPWPPSPARIDAEYRGYLASAATEALEEARARLPEDVSATTLVHHARSAPAGLLEAAERADASLIVVGSSSAGPLGQVTLGSVSSSLLHHSPLPVALATRGYRCSSGTRVTRATAAFGGTIEAEELVVAAAGVAARFGVSLRIASFAVLARPPYTSGVGREAAGSLRAEWTDAMRAAVGEALEQVKELPLVPHELETAVGYGESWEEALEDIHWDDGDVLVVGSSALGPMARVFLGSRATKIVRHSPVPAIVVPRGAAVELAEQAERGEGRQR